MCKSFRCKPLKFQTPGKSLGFRQQKSLGIKKKIKRLIMYTTKQRNE